MASRIASLPQSETLRAFAEILRAARNGRNLKQGYCAEALGISLRQYKRLEGGYCFPSRQTREKIRGLFPSVFPALIKRKDNSHIFHLLQGSA